ncbi:hypothetical protein [Lentibacillus sp. CBA3610]|uniref:hypothetical protein n=1 Tax=Lentibacillus sp. CBA3610 TaxID=2518176 RepID=UPI0015955A44|nr:hypothetical protein [Lentibacillus sp. CBA3610]
MRQFPFQTWAGTSKHGPEHPNMGRNIQTWAGNIQNMGPEHQHGPEHPKHGPDKHGQSKHELSE